jgi:hypothetical protein
MIWFAMDVICACLPVAEFDVQRGATAGRSASTALPLITSHPVHWLESCRYGRGSPSVGSCG